MPSKTKKQAAFMKRACHDPKFAKEHNISVEVACEFYRKDLEEQNKNKMAKEELKPAFIQWSKHD